MCPLLVANSGDVTDYTQPIDVAQDLTLKTLNTPVSYCVLFMSDTINILCTMLCDLMNPFLMNIV